jgi:hypothetical protein
MRALAWMTMARDEALRIAGNKNADGCSVACAEAIIRRIDYGLRDLELALQIQPSEAALAEVAAEQQPKPELKSGTGFVCEDCGNAFLVPHYDGKWDHDGHPRCEKCDPPTEFNPATGVTA